MSDEMFIAEYMAEQISSGNASHAGIVEAAQKEISKIDAEIKEIEKLRTRQNNLRSVIRQLGAANEVKRARRTPLISEATSSVHDMDPYMRSICGKICDVVDEHENVTPRQIMDSVGDLSEQKAVYAGIKWLLEQSVICRNEDGMSRIISVGSNWNNRPKE